jgi:hypothetical protein
MIPRDDNGTMISLGHTAFISMILKQFYKKYAHGVTTPIDPNVKLILPGNRGEVTRQGLCRVVSSDL